MSTARFPQSDTAPIRVVVADDHQIVVEGLERLLTDYGFSVTGTATTSSEAIALARRLQPDILLLDLRLPPAGGLAVLRTLRDEALPSRPILLTAALGDRDAIEARQLGVRGVVLKEMPSRQLVQCIRKVHAGGEFMEMASTTRAMDLLTKRERSREHLQGVLTARELEVLRAAATGAPNAEIGRRLSIGAGTVKMHLYSIYKKLKINSRVELMMYATRSGLAE